MAKGDTTRMFAPHCLETVRKSLSILSEQPKDSPWPQKASPGHWVRLLFCYYRDSEKTSVSLFKKFLGLRVIGSQHGGEWLCSFGGFKRVRGNAKKTPTRTDNISVRVATLVGQDSQLFQTKAVLEQDIKQRFAVAREPSDSPLIKTLPAPGFIIRKLKHEQLDSLQKT